MRAGTDSSILAVNRAIAKMPVIVPDPEVRAITSISLIPGSEEGRRGGLGGDSSGLWRSGLFLQTNIDGSGANNASRSPGENFTVSPAPSFKIRFASSAFFACNARIFSSMLPAATSL